MRCVHCGKAVYCTWFCLCTDVGHASGVFCTGAWPRVLSDATMLAAKLWLQARADRLVDPELRAPQQEGCGEGKLDLKEEMGSHGGDYLPRDA